MLALPARRSAFACFRLRNGRRCFAHSGVGASVSFRLCAIAFRSLRVRLMKADNICPQTHRNPAASNQQALPDVSIRMDSSCPAKKVTTRLFSDDGFNNQRKGKK